MELKRRQAYILRSLLVDGQEMSSAQLLENLGIAKRTFYYDIEKINDYLAENRLGRLVLSGSSIRAEVTNSAAAGKLLCSSEGYFFSIDERRAMEILFIALNSRVVTINRLMEYFDISKNTTLMDIKVIRRELGQWGLSLDSTIKAGYEIQGKETTVRKFLWIQFRRLDTPEGSAAIRNLLQQSMVHITGNDIDFFELCRCLIMQYESDIGTSCFLEKNGLETMMVQASWLRSKMGNHIDMDLEEQFVLMKTLSYRSVEFSAHKLKILGIEMDEREIYYITSLLLSIKTADFTAKDSENCDIALLAEKFIYHFEHIACLTFPNRERLQHQLVHHIRPMYFRLRYGIYDKNPLTADIRRMYPVVYEFTRRTVAEMVSSLPGEITEDELAYLCVYFASNLNEKFVVRGEPHSTDEVLIVGADNMAMATLVKEQLQDLLGLSFRYTVINKKALRKMLLNDFVLIVSLVPLGISVPGEKVVLIDAILTEHDKQRIMDLLLARPGNIQLNKQIQDILHIVKDNTSGEVQSERLYFDLLRYFEQGRYQSSVWDTVETFEEKRKPENIMTLPPGITWSNVVLLGARVLQGDRLVNKMQNLLRSHKVQSYRLASEIMLVHYPMQGEIGAKIDVRIFNSRDGVLCSDGQRAYIFLCLSTVDFYNHWKLLQEIYQYFEIKSHVELIKQIGLHDKPTKPSENVRVVPERSNNHGKNLRSARSQRPGCSSGQSSEPADDHSCSPGAGECGL